MYDVVVSFDSSLSSVSQLSFSFNRNALHVTNMIAAATTKETEIYTKFENSFALWNTIVKAYIVMLKTVNTET